MDSSTKREIEYYRWIRVFSSIGVVILHTFYVSYRIFEGSLTKRELFISKLFVHEMMWAVPCFLMVTGALLLNKGRVLDWKVLWKKYIPKMFFSLCFFVFVFRIFDMIMDKEEIHVRGILEGVKELFMGTSWSHLWYLYLLIGLYMLLPFVKKALNHSSEQEVFYLLLVLILFLSIVAGWKNRGFVFGFHIPIANIYPFYMILGYWLTSRNKKFSVWIGVLSFLIGSFGIGYFVFQSLLTTDSYDWYWGYSSYFVILQAFGIFTIFQNLEEILRGKKIVFLDKSSFGIYLIHMIWVRLIIRYWRWNPYNHGGFSMVGLILGIYLLSLGITWGVGRIPVLKKLLS